MKKMLVRAGSLLASLALFCGIVSANAPSVMFFHQPEIPESMNKYRK